MLKKLREKYPDRDIILIEGSYIGRDFGFRQYDTAISFETMHHMTHGEKVSVYEAVWNALTPKGLYIECDYMVLTQAEEDALYAKNARLRAKQNIPDGEFYHFDTPCTVENQLMLLREEMCIRDKSITWSSDDTSVATVSDTGLLTPVGGGTTTIRATACNGVYGTTTVSIVESSEELPEDLIIRKDGRYLIPADLTGNIVITDNAHNVSVVGSSSNTADNPYKGLTRCV